MSPRFNSSSLLVSDVEYLLIGVCGLLSFVFADMNGQSLAHFGPEPLMILVPNSPGGEGGLPPPPGSPAAPADDLFSSLLLAPPARGCVRSHRNAPTTPFSRHQS